MATPNRTVISTVGYTKIVDNLENYLVQNTEPVSVSVIGNTSDVLPGSDEVGYIIHPFESISNAELIEASTGTTCKYVYAKVVSGDDVATYKMST